MSRPVNLAWNYTYKNLQQTGAASDVTIWDPAAGKAVCILKIVVSTLGAALVQITEGADAAGTRILDTYMAANETIVLDFPVEAPLNLDPDSILTLTTSASNSKVSVLGVEV
ncbi:MAG: hypothetical protein GY720_15890 [bacterium]|nr:hypothetical protein [bacterium]